MKLFNICVAVTVVTSVAWPVAALAQAYKWRDDKGQIVYSDRPPPAGVPPANILQAPKGAPARAAAAASAASAGANVTAPAAPATKAAAAAPKSLAEQEVEYKKRQIEAQKKAKDDADKDSQEQQRQSACAGMRSNLAGLEGGQRISRTDDKGERSFITDEQRAADIARTRQEMAAAKC